MYLGSIQSPLVSIIVINYNYGRFIDQCLLSIARQTYPFIQCIVFDNASTDESIEVIDTVVAGGEFAGEGRSLSLVRSDSNLYQTRAAAEAVKHAIGPFVIFLDADDVILPTCVEAHVRAMLYVRQPVGASCVDYLVSSGDHLTLSSASNDFAKTVTAVPPGTAFCRQITLPPTSRGTDLDLKTSELHLLGRDVRGWPWSGTCGLCFRRTLVELLFRRVPDMKAQLDAYLILGVNCLAGSVLIDRPLTVYRHHSANIFAGGPRVGVLDFYDKDSLRENACKAQVEVITTLTLIAGELERYMDWNGHFLEAIETASNMWFELTPALPVSSYKLDYLLRNETVLAEAFGATDVDDWIRASVQDKRDAAYVQHRHTRQQPTGPRARALRIARALTGA